MEDVTVESEIIKFMKVKVKKRKMRKVRLRNYRQHYQDLQLVDYVQEKFKNVSEIVVSFILSDENEKSQLRGVFPGI